MDILKEVIELSLEDFIQGHEMPHDIFGNDLIIIELNGYTPDVPFQPMRLNAHSIMLVLEGEIEVVVDYVPYKLSKNTLLEMYAENIVDNIIFSKDSRGYHLIISHDLFTEILTPIISFLYKDIVHIKRAFPLRVFDQPETDCILDIIHKIRQCIIDEKHLYRSHIIRNELSNLIFELDNYVWKKYAANNVKIGKNESISFQFRQLLTQYSKTEHEVAFYASQLHMTPDHLSKIMRLFSGRSATKWINQALITEAKLLLRKPDINIQQVADALNFSDQSSFGKFFKKHTGKSPSQYKEILLNY